MEQADPLFLFIGLPAIPLGLFVAKLLRWEEAVLRMWRKHSNKLPIFGSLYQGELFKDLSYINYVSSDSSLV